jgi:hypothetical protein
VTKSLISLIAIHAKSVTTLQISSFVNLTDEVLNTIWINGSNNIKTIRFVCCDTKKFTPDNIDKLTRNCVYLEFLYLDGYGQGGSVTKRRSFDGNVLYLVNRDYKEVVTEEMIENLEKRKGLSQYNKDFLFFLEVEVDVRLEVVRYLPVVLLAGHLTDANQLVGEKREREE